LISIDLKRTPKSIAVLPNFKFVIILLKTPIT